METNETTSIEEVMETLGSEKPISIPSLFQFSDLTPDEFAHFRKSWPKLAEDRRHIIIRHLADLSEDNFEVDFSDVFSFGLTDASVSVRMASLDGLWDSDRVVLIEPIIVLVQSDPVEQVRSMAAATLGHYVLMGEWQQIPYKYVEPIIEALIFQIEQPSTPDSVKKAALESLGAASHPDVSTFIMEAYDSGDAAMQLSAVFAMGRSADPFWLSIVIDEMTNPSMEMRIEAARAAGSIGESESIAELAELVWDEDLEVRLVAVHSLGQIGGDIAVQILEDVIGDPDTAELHDAARAALEDMSIMGDGIDLSLIDWENDLNQDAFPSV